MAPRVLVWIAAGALAALAAVAWSSSGGQRARLARDVATKVPRVDGSPAAPLVAIDEAISTPEPQGRAEVPSNAAASAPDVAFGVVVRTSSGEELPGLDGRLTLRLKGRRGDREQAARSVEVEVVGGRARVARARFPGGPESLEVTGGSMDGRAFTPLRAFLSLPFEDDSNPVALLLQRKRVRLRVVDATTGLDLTRVQVADGSNVVVGQAFPGPTPDLLVKSGVSPLEFEVDGWDFFTPSIRVRAPGFAWAALRLTASEEGEQRLELRRGADLRVDVLDSGGLARRGDTFFTLTEYAVETGPYLHRVELADAVANGVLLEGLPPGAVFAAGAFIDPDARLGQSWRPIALERIELRAGEESFVQLDLGDGVVAAPARVDVPLRVVGAPGWPEATVRVSLRPRPGTHPDCTARTIDVDVTERGAAEPVPLEDVPSGDYELACRDYGFRTEVAVGPGTELEVVRPEPAVVEIGIERTAGLERLISRLDRRLLDEVFVGGESPEPIRVVTSPGRFEVSGEDDQGRPYYGATDARSGRNEVTLERAARVELRLRVDGEPTPFAAGGGRPSITVVSGPGVVVGTDWSRLRNPDRLPVVLSRPGRYRLEVELPAGVTALRPIEFDARHESRETVRCEASAN
ncbi:MAG: hypothetical protein AAGB93_21565 [Planctomycetota bacterium]